MSAIAQAYLIIMFLTERMSVTMSITKTAQLTVPCQFAGVKPNRGAFCRLNHGFLILVCIFKV
jgi:hypothetical protein